MPFLIQQRPPRLQTTYNNKISAAFPLSTFPQGDFHRAEENRLNLSQLQLQLQPARDREALIFSLEAAGCLVGEEIYWLQTEILFENEVVWRGEIGLFYDETLPNIRFIGAIPLPAAKLWSPEEPNLYVLHLTLFRGTKFLDRLETNFGLAKGSPENSQLNLINIRL
jgi:hypothetical protein